MIRNETGLPRRPVLCSFNAGGSFNEDGLVASKFERRRKLARLRLNSFGAAGQSEDGPDATVLFPG